MSPTRYTVIATDEAADHLASLWLNYPRDRNQITRASSTLEGCLRYDPLPQGTPVVPPRQPPRWYLDRLPLRVYYEVSEPDRLVTLVEYEYLPAIP